MVAPSHMSGPATSPAYGVRAILDRLDSLSGRSRVTVSDIVEAFGDAAFLPLMMVPALIVVSPLSGVPFLPTILGLTIAAIAGQAAIGRRRLWLPAWLMRRRLSGARIHGAIARLTGLATWLDSHSRDRFRIFVAAPFSTVVKLLCMACGLAMPFLELVPFSSSILAFAVTLFAVALLVSDGLYALLAVIFVALGALVPLAVYGGLFVMTP